MLNLTQSSMLDRRRGSVLHMDTPGQRLHYVMTEAEVNQVQLGKRVGVSKSAVNQWVSGKTQMTAQNIFRAADALGCSPRWLATGTGEAHSGILSHTAVRALETLSVRDRMIVEGQIMQLADLEDPALNPITEPAKLNKIIR